jgi:hypothetical protein
MTAAKSSKFSAGTRLKMNYQAIRIQYSRDAGYLRLFQIELGTNTAFYTAENAIDFSGI